MAVFQLPDGEALECRQCKKARAGVFECRRKGCLVGRRPAEVNRVSLGAELREIRRRLNVLEAQGGAE